jgi:hypothetical protein
MFPNPSIVSAITEDRLREAEHARLARRAAGDEQPPKPRRTRKLRALATRIAFTSLR